MRPAIFRRQVLDPHRERLDQFFSDIDVRLIEEQQRDLYNEYRTRAATRRTIDHHTNSTAFNEAWNDLPTKHGQRFYGLRIFAGGLGTIFANTTSVESDFSILNWEKDEFRKSLADLSLEGIFQSKQVKRLMSSKI